MDKHDHHYYWTQRNDNDWSTPTKIGLFNNIGDEFDANQFLGFDGELLYFYRFENRSVIFKSKFVGGEFSVPQTWNYKQLTKGDIFHFNLGNPNKMFFADKSVFTSKKKNSDQSQKVYEIYHNNQESPDLLELPSEIVKDGIYGLIPLGNNGLLYATYATRKSKRPEFHVITKSNDNWSIPIKLTIGQFSRKEFGAISSYSEKTREIFFTAHDKIYRGKLPEQLTRLISTDYPQSAIQKKEVTHETTSNTDKQVASSKSIKPTGKYYALLIGNADYELDRLDLRKPLDDAIKLKEILIKHYTFDPANVTVLPNASRNEIFKALFTLRRTLTENDNLLIFYAGHGFWDKDVSQGYWWPVDAQYDNPANWLSNSDLREQLSAINTAHTLLISDACFSGGIFKMRGAEEIRKASVDIQLLYRRPSRRAMTSGINSVPDNSVFLKFLTKYLEQNEEKYLPSSQLFASIFRGVMNNSLNRPQDGVILNTGDEGGDFIFIKKSKN